MRKRNLESFYRKFQKKRGGNSLSSDEEIIDQVFKETTYHPADKFACARYVLMRLNSLREYDRIKREETKKAREEQTMLKREVMEKKRKERIMREGAEEAGKIHKLLECLHSGEVSKEDMQDPKFKFEGVSPRKLGFGPPH